MIALPIESREIRLVRAHDALPVLADVNIVSAPRPEPTSDEVLVRNIFPCLGLQCGAIGCACCESLLFCGDIAFCKERFRSQGTGLIQHLQMLQFLSRTLALMHLPQ